MSKTLYQVLELYMNPAPEPEELERKKTNEEILKPIMEIYGKGGEK